MLSRIDSKELSEWAAFYSLEPFGGFRSDLQAGIVASTVANCNRTRQSKAFTPQDFMPIGEHRKLQVMDETDMIETLKAFSEAQEQGK